MSSELSEEAMDAIHDAKIQLRLYEDGRLDMSATEFLVHLRDNYDAIFCKKIDQYVVGVKHEDCMKCNIEGMENGKKDC